MSALTALPFQDGKGQYLLLAAEIADLRGIHNASGALCFEDALAALGRALGDDTMFTSHLTDIGDEDVFGKQSMCLIHFI